MRHRPRGACEARVVLVVALSDREGAGKTEPRLRPVAPVRKECTGQEPQVQPERPGLPRAMDLRLLRALPGDRLVCPRHPQQRTNVITNLTPASGRQDHTA